MRSIILILLLMVASISFGHTKTITLTDQNTIILDLAFDLSSTRNVMFDARKLVDHPFNQISTPFKRKDLYLVLNTPGGEIVPGLTMLDSLNSMNANINTITIFAASMGFTTVQSLGKRYITPHGVLMSHKASGGFEGEFPGQLDSRYKFWLKRIMDMDKNTVGRTKGKHTLDSYHKLMENEYWCEGVNCLKEGFVDEVVNVVCDSTLNGNFVKTLSVRSPFGMATVSVERAKCPLVLGYRVMGMKLNGKEYRNDNPYINELINKKLEELNNVQKNSTNFKFNR